MRFKSQINDHLNMVEKVKAKLRGEKDTRCKDKLVKAMTTYADILGDDYADINAEARRQLTQRREDGKDVWNQKKRVEELIKKIGRPDSALGNQQLFQCQQILESLYTLRELKQQQRSKFPNPRALIHVATQSLKSWRVAG